MKIGIIVAMDKELNLLLPLIDHTETVHTHGFDIHTGQIGHHQVALMKCGIGKVNAALGCSLLIQAFAPALVINSGVAGGVGSAEAGEVVMATRVGYHDVWCGPGTEPGQVEGLPRLYDCAELNTGEVKLRKGCIASGDRFISTVEEVDHILRMYPDAEGCDMESGAIAQTCHLFSTAFAVIRVISDTPGRHSDNGAQYASFWQKAPQDTFQAISAILQQL